MRTRARWTNVPNRGQNMVFVDQDHSPYAGLSLWELVPQLAMLDPFVGWMFYEDFLALPCDDTTHNPQNWSFAGSTAASSMTFPISLLGGVAQVATGAVDNNETYFQAGHGIAVAPFVITNASGKAVFFECRVKMLEVADLGCFIGLAEEGSAAASFLVADTGAIADKDFIGFNILTATPTAWNFTHRLQGQATQIHTGVAVNGADWHRFGFYFDGLNTVRKYIDGVLNATTHLTSAATFPSNQAMSPIIAVKTGEAVLKRIQVDYIKIVQIR